MYEDIGDVERCFCCCGKRSDRCTTAVGSIMSLLFGGDDADDADDVDDGDDCDDCDDGDAADAIRCWNGAGDGDIRILPNDLDMSSALLLVVALDVLTSELILDERSVR